MVKNYFSWDEHYSSEVLNFEETGDEGEIWFGKVSEQKICKFITDSFAEQKNLSIIEIGSGNGSLLRRLVS